MSSTDLKFFTNEDGRDLYARFCDILVSNTKFFDVLVGYFRSSGFFLLKDAMKDIENIRILVGLNVDKNTVDIIDSATIKESKEELLKKVEKEFEETDATAEIEEGVRIFIDWLKKGKIEMRMYTEHPIHAKVYIMRKDPDKVKDQYGNVITGSSNFSEAGLKGNLEFNVELKDKLDVEFALKKFEELWDAGVPIIKEYIETVEQKTWIRNDITPYEIYLKTIYEFFREEINADKEILDDEIFPDGYMRLRYQKDAVVQAKKILEAYNGVFISDVVGLGKTYICTMLAKILKKGKKLIICPPVLVDNWNKALLDFDVSAKVESLGKLEQLLEDGVEQYKYVFIDEAHRFRNAGTNAYEMLHKICHGKKVILISATPINNYSSDIENQLTLFQPKHDSIIPGVRDLGEFFATLRKKEKNFDKENQPLEFVKQQRKNSEEIRDKILRHVMIRRTRSEIKTSYSDDLKKQGLSFPVLGSPIPLVYVFDKETEIIFTETVELIKTFRYSRYKPLTYLANPTGELNTMMAAQENMGGFMKSILIKRLESSFFAFKCTLQRFKESYEKFIMMYEKGEVWISKKLNVFDLLDNGDVEKLLVAEQNDEAMHFASKDFDAKFIKDLKWDLNKLKYLVNLWDDVSGDPKLEQFKQDLQEDSRLSNSKKIIFTESKETAEYLTENLSELYGERVICYSGASTDKLKKEIEYSFDPKHKDKNKDKYDVLVATDILAEGVNLHRANILINYDLPWNPTRIMQRVGRINRVGSEYDEIFVFNFFPTAQTTEHMPLEERILEKLQIFHDTLGEDYKYLSDAEQASPQGLYDEWNKNLDQEEDTNPELEYLSLIRKIRDEDVELFDKIKKIPKKAKTGKYSSKIKKDSTVSFITKGALKTFYRSDFNEDAQVISFLDAIELLKCDSTTKGIGIGENFYKYYYQNNKSFDDNLREEDIIKAGKKAATSANDKQIIKFLKGIRKAPQFVEEQGYIIDKIIELFETGNIPKATSTKIVKELKIKKLEEPLEIYNLIKSYIDETYFNSEKYIKKIVDGEKQVILSCYMKGLEDE